MKQKAVKSRYYIKKEIDLIIVKINILRQNYYIFRKLYFVDGYQNIGKFIPHTLNFINIALLDKIIIELYKIVADKDKNVLSIPNFLKEFHNHRCDFREQKYIYVKDIDSSKKERLYLDTNELEKDIQELEVFLENNKKIIDYIKKDRNKIIAHNDKKMTFKKNYKPKELRTVIVYKELSDFIDELFSKMNNIYCTMYKTQYAYLEETDSELKHLNNILEDEKKKYEIND